MKRLLGIAGLILFLSLLGACENLNNYTQEPFDGAYSAYMPEYKPSEREYDTMMRNAVKLKRRLPQIGRTPEELEVEFADKHKGQLFNIPGYPGLGDNGVPSTPPDRTQAYMPYPFQYTPLLFLEDVAPNQIQIEKDDMLTFLPLILGLMF